MLKIKDKTILFAARLDLCELHAVFQCVDVTVPRH